MGEFLQNYGIWIVVVGFLVWMYRSGGSCCGHAGDQGDNGDDAKRQGANERES